jgi:PilZ domain
MPELIRSVVSRMRVYFGDRRRSPRLSIRLLFSLSVCRSSNGNGSQHRERVLRGHTRDIGVGGLALNVPQVHLDGHHLATSERELQLRLELPGGPISMLVFPRHYERLEEAELGCNYLIGAEISQMDDEDRERYLGFVAQGLEGKL